MPKFIIEREIPNAGKLSGDDLKGIAAKSNGVVRELGPDIQWVHSYVTDNKVFCVYNAANEEILKKHAEGGNFPLNAIYRVANMMDPVTGE